MSAVATPSPPRSASRISNNGKSGDKGTPAKSSLKRPKSSRSTTSAQEGDEAAWGSNFWVTLVDPQTETAFYACPATGQVSWDPPVGNFVLPPSADGEWWELVDDSRGGLPYYYQTKSGETVWERPQGFVIPLAIIQNTALGRRLSNRVSKSITLVDPAQSGTPDRPSYRRAQSTSASGNANASPSGSVKKQSPSARRSFSNDQYSNNINLNGTSRLHTLAQHLPPIPASPYSSEASESSSPTSQKSRKLKPSASTPKLQGSEQVSLGKRSGTPESSARSKSSSSYIAHRPLQPQSLNAAVEMFAGSQSQSDSGHSHYATVPSTTAPTIESQPAEKPTRPIPATPVKKATVGGRSISAPVLNQAATIAMSPVKNRATGKPILVQPRVISVGAPTVSLSSGSRTYPALPHDLASDILQFSESDFAKQYFSTHRAGFIFRRRIPVAQMMAWQKAPLTTPLLALNRDLSRNAVKVFKIIQHIMGDRDRAGAKTNDHLSQAPSVNSSNASLSSTSSNILEQERWLLGEGLTHGELRDEIYCQIMKQLTSNPSAESVFKGWQLLSVLLITFPPSKNFETYLQAFIQQHTSKQEGRVDIMAKHCLRRLGFIAIKGPRGKPPTVSEIETASDAAFHPSTFGESLDAIIRLQERNYPHQKVPIILPFLADGILALGGTKAEGIFRVPGDGDSVSDLKLRIDKGYYTLDGVDDPHILASLMKLWLRELCDPLVPEEMYNECISSSKDPEACVHIVERLPTINRRVVLFVVSFLQLFLDDRTQTLTKMTPANLALVMAPNLLRCNSDSMAVVFTNAQYEQIFVYNLLLHLKCGEVDGDYTPAHGLGAVPAIAISRTSKSKSRRNPY